MALNSQGSKISHAGANSPTDFQNIEEVKSISGPNGTLSLLDASHLQSTRKEYLPGLADNGTIDIECNYVAGTQQMLLFDMFNNTGDPENFLIEVPTDSTRTSFYEFAFAGIMSKWALGDAVDSIVKLTMTIQTTGGVTFNAPTP